LRGGRDLYQKKGMDEERGEGGKGKRSAYLKNKAPGEREKAKEYNPLTLSNQCIHKKEKEVLLSG